MAIVNSYVGYVYIKIHSDLPGFSKFTPAASPKACPTLRDEPTTVQSLGGTTEVVEFTMVYGRYNYS
jgi:hypothetical protein